MSFEFEAPEDVTGGGDHLGEPGTYHFVVTAIKEGQGSKGSPIDGFTIEMDCLGGTADGAAGKSHSEALFAPDMSKAENSQLMAKRKLAAFFIATDLMKPEQLGKPCKINLQEAEGRQFVMKLARQMEKDANGNRTVETRYLQINFSDIFHVDDPEVKEVPKNAEALELIDKAHRHDEAYFAFKAKKKAATKPKPADNFDDF